MKRKIVKIDFQGMTYNELLGYDNKLCYKIVNAEKLRVSEALAILLQVLNLYKEDNSLTYIGDALEKAYLLNITRKEKEADI